MKSYNREKIPANQRHEDDDRSLNALKVADSSHPQSMISFIIDLPNVFTLGGLLSALIGIYFAIQGLFYFAVICGAWAVLFDWMDGLIASKMKGRTDDQRDFGRQLDSLIDIVSFGVLPAIILLSYADYSLWFMPGAFAIIAASAIRLSYFNIFGLTEGKTYTGLAVDYTGLLLSFAFLFESFFSKTYFSIGLYTLMMSIVVLNLASIQIPKFSKKWIYGIAAYVIGLTIYLGSAQ
ncbi:MAG: CDP-alcohol phosphatidyltransferase family protein [Cyclobacteriaceae bacterium]|nr:CDP-alcohol phosphatidyltransferase family protein [Cyclobacteriaceae bacterium]